MYSSHRLWATLNSRCPSHTHLSNQVGPPECLIAFSLSPQMRWFWKLTTMFSAQMPVLVPLPRWCTQQAGGSSLVLFLSPDWKSSSSAQPNPPSPSSSDLHHVSRNLNEVSQWNNYRVRAFARTQNCFQNCVVMFSSHFYICFCWLPTPRGSKMSIYTFKPV